MYSKTININRIKIDSWTSGKKPQDQYFPLFYKNIAIDGKFSI
jgi:hypothetical protein